MVLAVAISGYSLADEPPVPKPKVIASFESTAAIQLQPARARTEILKRDGTHALQITTEGQGGWPGVLLQPRSGAWDLRGFDQVEMDVHNPQEIPLRVLLSINNPGADGRRHCNTAGVNVPAKGKSTLLLPFGTWHGDVGHPLDESNIVSLRVFLDRPDRAHRFIVNDIRATAYDRRTVEQVFADPFFVRLQPVFGRGVNLGNALEAPNESDWGVVLQESYFEAIAMAGFDSVRIPVRWSAHTEVEPPYRIDPKFIQRVDWAVRQSLARDLRPIVNMHHYAEIMERPDAHRQRFFAMWRQIAEHYKEFPKELAFELLNEPQENLAAEKWNELLAATIPIVRRSNPTRTIIVGPADFNDIDQLEHLKLPADDRHLIVTVHYYRPFAFTHQGAPWVGGESRAWLGKKWTGTPAEKLAVIRDFDRAITWAVQHRRPLYLGEFGAYQKADLESRVRWTRFIADEASERKIGFGYWEFCSGFGVYDAKTGRWREPLRQALISKE